MSMCRSVAFAAALLAVLASPAWATIVVAAAGGGDFTSLQAALDAAADGEQVLVRSGAYAANPGQWRLRLAGKGLSIVADTGAVVTLPGLEISDVPAGHWVMLRGLTLGPVALLGPEASLLVTSTGGTVWAEDCTITGRNGEKNLFFSINTWGSPAVRVDAGGAATLVDCSVKGGWGAWHSSQPGQFDPTPGGAGVEVIGGRLAVHGGSITGGDGGYNQIEGAFAAPPDGGDGIVVLGAGFAHVAGALVTGGTNGGFNQVDTDQAGDGLHLTDGVGKAWLRGATLVAGAVLPVGQPGLPLNAPAGTVTTFTAPVRTLDVTSPLREGQPGTLTVQGQPGDAVLLLVALGAGFQPLSGKQGVFLLDPSVLLLPVALAVITDPSGTLAVPFITPDLNPALEGLTVPLQLGIVAGGQATLENGTLLAWLDAGI
jgi:hypothetical protein